MANKSKPKAKQTITSTYVEITQKYRIPVQYDYQVTEAIDLYGKCVFEFATSELVKQTAKVIKVETALPEDA